MSTITRNAAEELTPDQEPLHVPLRLQPGAGSDIADDRIRTLLCDSTVPAREVVVAVSLKVLHSRQVSHCETMFEDLAEITAALAYGSDAESNLMAVLDYASWAIDEADRSLWFAARGVGLGDLIHVGRDTVV